MGQTTRNIIAITLIVLLGTVQILIVTVCIFRFIPIPVAPIAKGVVPQLLQLFHPKRDINFYRYAILEAMALQVLLMYIFRRSIEQGDVAKHLRPLILNNLFWVCLQIFAAFKLLQYQNPLWAQVLFYVALAGGALSQVFWPEFKRWISGIRLEVPPWAVDIGVIILLAGAIFVPHAAKSLYFMAAVIYMAGFYFFLKVWCNNVPCAVLGVLLMVKLNLFNWGQFPSFWNDINNTFLRNIYDLPALYFMYRHARSEVPKDLTIAAILVGIAGAQDALTGLALLGAFYSYMAVQAFLKPTAKQAIGRPWLAVLPLAAWGFVVLCRGKGFGLSSLFDSHGTFTIFSPLFNRQFFAFDMAFIVPCIYILTVMFIAGAVFLKQIKLNEAFILPVAVYGLGWYQAFLLYSKPLSYYAGAMPLVFVLMFWLNVFSAQFWKASAAKVFVLLAILALGALLTNTVFLSYHQVYHVQ